MKVFIISFSILAVVVLAYSVPPPPPRGAGEPASSGNGSAENGPETLVVPMAGEIEREGPEVLSVPMLTRSCTCECNMQAVACAPDTGRCHCSTKGLVGDRCDECDNFNHFYADIYNKDVCYYDLALDYQFTFDLSKKKDRHLTAINFRNAPVKPDVDADFSITCSAQARMNLTVRTQADPQERTLFTDVDCTNFRFRFAKSEHSFGVEDNVELTTFFVYVYDLRPPLWIQISFSQPPKLNLQQFFITFSWCLFLLLIMAAVLWKIKQKYDMNRTRQRLFIEMEQMAS